MEVEQLAIRFEYLEAMGAALGNEQCVHRLGAQFHRAVAQESGRVAPQIDRDVEHPAPEAADPFGFGKRRCLEMQPAQGSGPASA